MAIKVFIEKSETESSKINYQFLRASDYVGLSKDMKTAKKIFIKPNLTYPTYKEGVTTRSEFVEALVKVLTQINPNTKILIGDGEGGYNSFSMTKAMEAMGFYKIDDKYPNVEILNLSELPSEKVILQAKSSDYPLNLPSILLHDVDFSISCPLPKVHCMTKITLSYKNQWGCVPDTMRLKNHYVLDEILCQICDKMKFKYAFLDGKIGMDENGPMDGKPVEVNWFVAANSLGAFDRVVSEMMGFDWKDVPHIKMAEKFGLMPSEAEIKVVGNLAELKRRFTLNRIFWNYLALAAFYSKNLTHLFYFSRYSKLLHDIMYTFRQRPIE